MSLVAAVLIEILTNSRYDKKYRKSPSASCFGRVVRATATLYEARADRDDDNARKVHPYDVPYEELHRDDKAIIRRRLRELDDEVVSLFARHKKPISKNPTD